MTPWLYELPDTIPAGGLTPAVTFWQTTSPVVYAQRAEALMRSYAEEIIERRYQQGFAQGREEGRLLGFAESLLQVLTVRGVHVDDASRERIRSCSDAALLELWLDRAIHATSLSEVLAPPSQ